MFMYMQSKYNVGTERLCCLSFLKTPKTSLMQGLQTQMPIGPEGGVNEESDLVGIGVEGTHAPQLKPLGCSAPHRMFELWEKDKVKVGWELEVHPWMASQLTQKIALNCGQDKEEKAVCNEAVSGGCF